MGYLVTIARRVLHLFVDDTAFAAAIVAWPAMVWLAMRLGAPYLGAMDRVYRARPKA
jgi:hypothetical protein